MSIPADLIWTTARDGSRTARVGGRWLAGCSVPKRSSELMLRKLQVKGNVVCLLLPTHAQQIEVLLDRLDPLHAAIVIAEDQSQIELFNACSDFSKQIHQRLFFATDAQSLVDIFKNCPGLPIPQQFIRLPITPIEKTEPIIKWAQQAFAEVTKTQTQIGQTAKENWSRQQSQPCVLARTRFSLWNDSGYVLSQIMGCDCIDLSYAKQTATGYITQIASKASALVTADFARADQKELLHPDQPWITWITQNRVPVYLATSPQDAILLADASLKLKALSKGWPAERIGIAEYPVIPMESTGEGFALIADIPSLNPPEIVKDYSSWRLVWEAMQKDLIENPQRLAGDIDGYLEKARKYFSVPVTNFPDEIFIRDLIAPAYLIGIARWLVREGISISIYGKGFEDYADLQSSYRGTIASRDQLRQAIAQTCGMINPFIDAVHPICAIGKPQVVTFGRTPQRILQDIQTIRAGRGVVQQPESPLTKELISHFLSNA